MSTRPVVVVGLGVCEKGGGVSDGALNLCSSRHTFHVCCGSVQSLGLRWTQVQMRNCRQVLETPPSNLPVQSDASELS